MLGGVSGLSLSADSFSAHWHVRGSSGFCSDGDGYFHSGIGKYTPRILCNPFLAAVKDALKEEEIENGERSFGEAIP